MVRCLEKGNDGMRPLTKEDYLLIGIVILTAIAGICALLIVAVKVREEIRERAAVHKEKGVDQKIQPAGMRRRRTRSQSSAIDFSANSPITGRE